MSSEAALLSPARHPHQLGRPSTEGRSLEHHFPPSSPPSRPHEDESARALTPVRGGAAAGAEYSLSGTTTRQRAAVCRVTVGTGVLVSGSLQRSQLGCQRPSCGRRRIASDTSPAAPRFTAPIPPFVLVSLVSSTQQLMAMSHVMRHGFTWAVSEPHALLHMTPPQSRGSRVFCSGSCNTCYGSSGGGSSNSSKNSTLCRGSIASSSHESRGTWRQSSLGNPQLCSRRAVVKHYALRNASTAVVKHRHRPVLQNAHQTAVKTARRRSRRLASAGVSCGMQPRELVSAVAADPEASQGAQGMLSSSLGANLAADGSCVFSVWAPHAQSAELLLWRKVPAATAAAAGDGAAAHGEPSGSAGWQHEEERLAMARDGNVWMVRVANVSAGSKYCFEFTHAGQKVRRRDARARATDYDSDVCFVVDPTFAWSPTAQDFPGSFDELNIYQLHVGAFTGRLQGGAIRGGTFEALEEKLDYIKSLGFTAIEMLPVHEYCGSWGYNPRLLFAIHPNYGPPKDLQRLVDAAHMRGLAVIFDVVLNHGAAKLNSLWAYDGLNEGNRGGLYFDGGSDTAWGRTFAWWQKEVKDMVVDAARMFLAEFNGDGLRFDCVQAMPWDLCQRLTWELRHEFPEKILISEITPERPEVITGAGFDATWIHSSYYDMRAFMKERRSVRKLESLLRLHPGYSKPTQCIKYFLGSHDQIGCRKNGGYDEEIQGHHRYAVELFGGRDSWDARAIARMWYACQVVAQGIPMAFMGTEWHHSKWWGVDRDHNLNWDLQGDAHAQHMMALVTTVNALRSSSPALLRGGFDTVHSDATNAVLGFVRQVERERLLVVVNASGNQWEKGDYGVGVGGIFQEGSRLQQVFNSQDGAFGGWETSGNAGREIHVNNGKLRLNVPKWSVMVFRPCP